MTTRTMTPTCIAEIMTHNPICVTPTMTVRELAALLDADEISGVPVVDAQNRIVGVVSKTDLLHYCLDASLRSDRSFFETLTDGLDPDELSEIDVEALGVIEQFMSTEPVTVSQEDSIFSVARRMTGTGVHRVIVTDEFGRVEGIVSALDVLRAFPA
ncbi:MAG: CBS domain-containing protein [Phycisphaerales bacterium]|nr:CBS domain-containing protein [Phycisphaerales bacterium]NNM26821.1 CBS domain-containing protein [Phycisphaerales bacterium]